MPSETTNKIGITIRRCILCRAGQKQDPNRWEGQKKQLLLMQKILAEG